MSTLSQLGSTLYIASAAQVKTYTDTSTGLSSSVVNFLTNTTVTINKTPAVSTDAVNKGYLDTIVSSLSTQINSLTSLTNSDYDNLNSLLNSYHGSDLASLASESSRAQAAEVSLTSSIASEMSRGQAAESVLSASIVSEMNRAQAAESVLSSSIVTETNRAQLAESNLSSSITSEISRAHVAEASLTSSVASEMSRAQAGEASLTSSVASEMSRAQAAEASLTSSVASEMSRAQAAEASLTSSVASEMSRAQAAEASLTTSVANANCKLVRSIVVPLNTYTIGGGGASACPPQYICPSTLTTATTPMVDGWYFTNSTVGTKIQWGSVFTDNAGSYSLDIKTGVNQIYFTAYINGATNAGDLPYITLYTYNPTGFYTEKVVFVPSTNVTAAGYYTFVANVSGNTNVPPALFNSTNVALNYNQSSCSPNTYPTLTQMQMQITKPVYYITVQSNSTSTAGKVNFILTDLFVEANASNAKISAGTYNYKFTNSVVANNFLYTALNNLYNEFYSTNITATTFPGKTSYSGY